MKKLTIALALLLAAAAWPALASEATDTIDYAITKIAELQPVAQKLGHEYAEFVVFKATLQAAIWTALAVVVTSVMGVAAWKRKNEDSDAWDSSWFVVLIVSAICELVVAIGCSMAWYYAAIAHHNPMMYAISQIAGR